VSAMQAIKLLFTLTGAWKFAVGRDANTQQLWMDIQINEGGGGWLTFNLNLGKNSNHHRSQFIYIYAFKKLRYFKMLDKKSTG
jgi:hypothetical protein